MTFNSLQYGVFLAVVVVVLWSLPRRWRNAFLLLASYVFYASWDWRFMALILISTAIGYSSGIALHAAEDEGKRKRILATRIVLNLLLLGVFKYFNFFIDTGVSIADAAGLGVVGPSVRILLPIAISYMTFEEIAYAMDIYRRQIEPTRNPIEYGLFVAFFPKLVAGPILRPKELLPQIAAHRPPPSAAMVQEGLLAHPPRTVQEGGRRRHAWPASPATRSTLPARSGPSRWWSACTRSRCRSTGTSPATATSPGGVPCCSGSTCR